MVFIEIVRYIANERTFFLLVYNPVFSGPKNQFLKEYQIWLCIIHRIQEK